MNNDFKGLCLFLGMIGLAYVAMLLVLLAFTGLKIVKSILVIFVLSSSLVAFGLKSEVKARLIRVVKRKLSPHI
ncbi:hypothetical protein PULV_b0414 [Pseudoalteromonas ulvae UL12]|nr:hypothetical protein [Pseudoalteromonas ulvae]MBE0365758.1 hypothetical protein [Pseudoalteromonas ulvae UL12]